MALRDVSLFTLVKEDALMQAIIVAVLGMIGALGGSWIANRKNMALIEYRLKQLEEKVNKHNNLIERTYQLEKQVAIIQEEIKE